MKYPDPRRRGALGHRAHRRFHKIVCRYRHRQRLHLQTAGGLISFTFDDFSRSAAGTAREILERHEMRGTYYVSMDRAGTTNHQGAHFEPSDLVALADAGHEIGCHTMSHHDLLDADAAALVEAELADNAAAVDRYLPGYSLESFAYPYGNVTPASKQLLGRHFSSCRGTERGINAGRVDRAFLRANELAGGVDSVAWAERLIRRNESARGWLVFFTHDVRPDHSPFGCSPEAFERVVAAARQSRCWVLPVREALACAADQSTRVKPVRPPPARGAAAQPPARG